MFKYLIILEKDLEAFEALDKVAREQRSAAHELDAASDAVSVGKITKNITDDPETVDKVARTVGNISYKLREHSAPIAAVVTPIVAGVAALTLLKRASKKAKEKVEDIKDSIEQMKLKKGKSK